MTTSLEKATKKVDDAWQRWKENPTARNLALYEQAYDAWRALGNGGRGVGRPPSSDLTTLSSSERAQQARARQQQSAARWERVAPTIQCLRRAIEAGDSAAVSKIANSLAKETAMVLSDVQVVHAQPDGNVVVLQGWHGQQRMLAFISRKHLEDYFRRSGVSGKAANLLVDRNLASFSKIISAKYERGETRPYSRLGTTVPSIDIAMVDMQRSGEQFTDSVLNVPAGWMASDGRLSPGE
jgi:hypothetical protein